jgi:hypothetical protein
VRSLFKNSLADFVSRLRVSMIEDRQYVNVKVPANSTTGVNTPLDLYPKGTDTIQQLKAMISGTDTFAIIIRNRPANLARPADTAKVEDVLKDGDVIDISTLTFPIQDHYVNFSNPGGFLRGG